jgi:ribosomal protein S18 acetylase RimI-like enzyme
MTRSFDLATHDLGSITLEPLKGQSAAKLAEALAAMPPWSVIGWPADRLARAFSRSMPSVNRFEVVAGGKLAGIVTVQSPFLHGPYLQLLAILPDFQGQKLGQKILEWMEAQARHEEARQLWLCVSSFNTRAQIFYRRFGFEQVALLERLASDAADEIFMRKRLSYAAA